MEYDKWAERIKSDSSQFTKSNDTTNSGGAWSRRMNPQRPKLSTSPSPTHHHLQPPSPRAQAIARHRMEMLEMVRSMPETNYELSLRDMVESQPMPISKPEVELPAVEEITELPKNKIEKKKEKKRWKGEKYYLDAQLLVKLFMPLSMGGRKKRLSSFSSTAKISPKPKELDQEEGWRIKSGEGSNRTSSSTSSSSSSKLSSRSRKMKGCYSFFQSNKSKSRES